MPSIYVNEDRKAPRRNNGTLSNTLRLARDFGEEPRAVAVIRGGHVVERYQGDAIRDLAKGRLVASGYVPTSVDSVAGVMLVFMPSI